MGYHNHYLSQTVESVIDDLYGGPDRPFGIGAIRLEGLEAKKPYLARTYCPGLKDQEEINQYLNTAAECDPTDGVYIEWVLNHIRNNKINIPEDSERINLLLSDFIARKTRLVEKDILKYDPDSLEIALKEINTLTRGQRSSKDYKKQLSVILFTKSYIDKNMAILGNILGKQANQGTKTFWLRKILTVEGAVQYGKGTEWCTSSSNDWYEDHGGTHPAESYFNDGGLISIEIQTPSKRRHPSVLLARYEAKGPQDNEISFFKPDLARFIKDAFSSAAAKDIDTQIKTHALSKMPAIGPI